MSKKTETHIKIFSDRSELVHPNQEVEVFHEGAMLAEVRKRYEKIEKSLQAGFLEKLIGECRKGENIDTDSLSKSQIDLLNSVVDKVNANEGRALVGLSIMQLTIKTIAPDQNIRLHKGGENSFHFSWKEGISMRSIDNTYITPALRKHQLLSLNADGIMMTRSLAENYPYSALYKAQLKGPRVEWLALVEEIEVGTLNCLAALKFLLSKLINRSKEFDDLAEKLIKKVSSLKTNNINSALKIMSAHIEGSNHAARVMEVQMHSFMQALGDLGLLTFKLGKLSQMRNANKKHGNIGDVELFEGKNIVEAWDAKFGKSYFRDEIEELAEKVEEHPRLKVAGFVCNTKIQREAELKSRITEIESEYDISLVLINFDDWIDLQIKNYVGGKGISEEAIAKAWLRAYAESLSLRRTEIAPIDEPCQQWVESLLKCL